MTRLQGECIDYILLMMEVTNYATSGATQFSNAKKNINNKLDCECGHWAGTARGSDIGLDLLKLPSHYIIELMRAT